MLRNVIIQVGLFTFLLCGSVLAQERMDAREEAGGHYLQGKDLYSQGRYKEATVEFEKAITLAAPAELQFEEKIQKAQDEVMVSGLSQEAGAGFKSTATLATPAELQFEEKIQKGQEKVLVSAPASSKEKQSKKKLIEKKKEEKEESGFIETALTEAPASETEDKEYYIDLGDVLDISVWRVPDLSRSEVIVRPDGKISFPLIGDLKAEGLTLTQLDDILTERLKTYVKVPQVSIMIRRFGEQTNKVVVLGEILSPGIYKFGNSPTITEVVASAGGYTKYAVLNSIMVISGDIKGNPDVERVNFASILKSGSLKENIFLKPNDIVYIPRSFIGNINAFLEVFQPAIGEYMQTLNARYLHNVVHRNK